MKLIFSEDSSEHRIGKNLGDTKEMISCASLIVTASDRSPHELASVRWYKSRGGDGASPVYCSVWIFPLLEGFRAGTGCARGYGYHKRSAALEAALREAGITLEFEISGDSATAEVLNAIARHYGHLVISERLVVNHG